MLISHSYFKLSLLTLAIFQTQSSFADSTEKLPTEVIQASSSPDQASSEKTKAYIIQKSNSATKLNIPLKETPQTIRVC